MINILPAINDTTSGVAASFSLTGLSWQSRFFVNELMQQMRHKYGKTAIIMLPAQVNSITKNGWTLKQTAIRHQASFDRITSKEAFLYEVSD